MESRESYFSFGDNNPHLANMTVVAVSYKDYKNKYNNHKQVTGSYNKTNRTIELYFSQKELKNNFGNRYAMDNFNFIIKEGAELFCGQFKAKTFENSLRNAKKYCKNMGFELICKVDRDKSIGSYGVKNIVDCSL
jgi:hypothetical protein